MQRLPLLLLFSFVLFAAACDDDDQSGAPADPGTPSSGEGFLLTSVVIDAEGNRTTFAQAISSLDDGPFDNTQAIEIPGNGIVLAQGNDFFVGLTESPTWIRYTVAPGGEISETGRLSFLNLGVSRIDFGNTLVDAQTAVSVLGEQAIAVVWNPTTMEIVGEVDLSHLVVEGFPVEVWTTSEHEGLVYIPGRWSDFEGSRIRQRVSLTIVDPKELAIVGIAEDDRCASGGRPVFDDAGYAYVMGDGRNYSSHMFANAMNQTAADNCLLRIAPGETDFESDFYVALPSLTDGRQSITELETASQGGGLAFAKMFHPDRLPDDVEPVDFGFWNEPAHKLWRIELGDAPRATQVEGIPFSTIGFAGSSVRGKLYTGESPDGSVTDVFEIDPASNRAEKRFEMDGLLNGLFELSTGPAGD